MPYKYQSDATAHMREWRAKNRGYYNEYTKQRRDLDREHYNQLAKNWRAKNRERVNQEAVERYHRNIEKMRKRARQSYKAHREARRNYDDMRRADSVVRQRYRQNTKRWYAYCKACRQELRLLVEQFPAVAKHIDIDIEGATDGQVRQFYDQLMKELKDAKYFYTRQEPKGKSKDGKTTTRPTVRGPRSRSKKR